MNLRNQALAAGQRTYNTGKPCKRDHMADRYASNGMCVECTKNANEASIAARIQATRHQHVLSANAMEPNTIHVQSKYNTIIKTIERLLTEPDADQFVTWLMMIDTRPLSRPQIVDVFGDSGKLDMTDYPQHTDMAGYLYVEIGGCWYVADHLMEVLHHQRPHALRVAKHIWEIK